MRKTGVAKARFMLLLVLVMGVAHGRAEPLISPFSAPSAAPGDVITVHLPGGVPLDMVVIPAGNFMMGSNDGPEWSPLCHPCEQPVHPVTIGYPFHMGRFEVTQRQWTALMGSLTVPEPEGSTRDPAVTPVDHISWHDIRDPDGFLDRLNAHIAATGQGDATFRLPSEAEWEYACRAGTTTRYSHGDSDCTATSCAPCDLGDYAWFCGNNIIGDPSFGSKPVGTRLPNPFGLFDMHGNVYEWCEDRWNSTHAGAPGDGSARLTGEPASTDRVLRGGAWIHPAWHLRSASRVPFDPTVRYFYFGLRVVQTGTLTGGGVTGVEDWRVY